VNGNLCLFGGWSNPSINGAGVETGLLNDMWQYNPATNKWTWIGGSSEPDQYGVLDSQHLENNMPGARSSSTIWQDINGNTWLFGGFGYTTDQNSTDQKLGNLNDLWKYDVSNKLWAQVNGSDLTYQNGAYGEQGSPGEGDNTPGARQSGNKGNWVDNAGNLWLFGGGVNNDLWSYNPLSNQWTWVSGTNMGSRSGHYGVKGEAYSDKFPGGRFVAASWTDAQGNFWLFGGQGRDGVGGTGSLNDLWKIQLTTTP
jgi:hypothetical protein